MGFPIGCSELLLFPKVLLQLVFLLGNVRRAIGWAFDKAGLGDLVEMDMPWPQQQQQQCVHIPEFQSVTSLLIEEILPVVRYEGISAEEEKCAVCLYEVEAGDEVRRLSNCRHVFHKGCLDRWIMDHDHRTCPLCRTALVPEEMQDAFNGRIWAAAGGLPDSYSSNRLLYSS